MMSFIKKIKVTIDCPKCEGSGIIDFGSFMEEYCKTCNQTGEIELMPPLEDVLDAVVNDERFKVPTHTPPDAVKLAYEYISKSINKTLKKVNR